MLRRQAAEAQLQAKAAEERAKLAEEQAGVVESIAEGLRNLSDGNLAFRLGNEFPETYKQIRDDFNTAIAGLQETITAIASAARKVASASAGDLYRYNGPVPAHRGTGRESGGNLCIYGANLRDSEKQR